MRNFLIAAISPVLMAIFCGWIVFQQFTPRGRECHALGGAYDPLTQVCKLEIPMKP